MRRPALRPLSWPLSWPPSWSPSWRTSGQGNRHVRLRPMGLRTRLTAAFLAVALLAALVASGISYVLVRRALLQRSQDAQLIEFRQVVQRSVPVDRPPGTGRMVAAQINSGLEGRGRTIWAQPVSMDLVGGDRRPPRIPSAIGPVSETFLRRALSGMVFQRVRHHGHAYLLVGGTAVGREAGTDAPILVVMTVSLRHEEQELASFTRALMIADGLAVLAAVAMALAATRGVLRPVRGLGRAARALGAGDFSTRVSERGRDELTDLARTFNRTAEALERMVGELRAKDAASRRFVADVSHELRTPLTSMVAMAEVLADDGDQAARLVASETRRLGDLVEHLIEISRFDAGAASLVLDDVLLADAVAATLDARGWTGEAAVTGPDDLVVRLDPRRLDVIVANLVGNAVRHGKPPITIAYRPERDGVELTVTDNGPGIPEDVLPLVFNRFVKAEEARSRSDGSGLGLSIARENAVLHGGTLDVSNGPEGGAVFTLWLPSATEEEAE
ncbi:sensor histidine kinase [Actinomadura rupiterrae]|uniref:sensor histidine kinase n=1 Tax=Actinomadura rupiterrae TaxID=559627 RepID=UPI0020A52BB1|nr:HAMP domain-containing sensor histidine kinase [Actinomadura rupiterrae]MCP2338574.1 two-component system sensor histidine kinase MtrB [Actinomadura rupiterrae]